MHLQQSLLSANEKTLISVKFYLYLLQEAVARGKSGITTARKEYVLLNLKLIFLRLPLPYESLDLRVNKWK